MHQDGHSKINAIVSRDEAQQIHNCIGLPKHGSAKKSRGEETYLSTCVTVCFISDQVVKSLASGDIPFVYMKHWQSPIHFEVLILKCQVP